MKKLFQDIPNNWDFVKIPEVLFFQEGPGVRKHQFTESGIKLLNVGNINNKEIDLDATDKYISEEEANGKYSHFLVNEGDLLIACSGVVVDNFHNKIAFAKKEHLPLCLNTSTMRFKIKNDRIDLNYFKYFLQTLFFKRQLQKLITGSAQLNFGPSHIKKIELPLPPLSIQKQIASILDQADKLVQLNKVLIEKYDELAQSIFLNMFGDTYFNQFNWPIKELNDICLNIVDCPHSTPKYVDYKSDFPCIRTTELKNGIINWSSMKYLDEPGHLKRIKRLTPEKGDIVYGREGTFGEAVLIPSDCKMSLGQRVVLIRPNTKIVLNEFLLSVLRSRGLYYQALKVNSGSTVGHVNMKDIRKFKIPVPPLDMQERFVEKIKNLKKQVGIIKESSEKSIDLFNSLIQKSFKGELIKSDEYETA